MNKIFVNKSENKLVVQTEEGVNYDFSNFDEYLDGGDCDKREEDMTPYHPAEYLEAVGFPDSFTEVLAP